MILLFGVLTVFSALGLARFGYGMILPSMREGLGLDNTLAGALATGNFIGYLVFALIGGFLVARLSQRVVISVSLLVVGTATALTGTAGGFTTALFWRIIAGMGSGSSNVPMMGLLSSWFTPSRRGLATGIAVTGSSFGLILTGPLVPYIINRSPDNGWRWAWVIIGGIIFIVGILALLFVRNHPADKNLSPLGTNTVEPEKRAGTAPAIKAPDLRAWSAVWKSGAVWRLAFIYTAFGFSYIIYLTFFASYLLSDAIGFSKETAGRLFLMIGWISILCGVIWGWFSDVFGRGAALAVVNFLQGTSYIIFALWISPTGVVISAVIFGLTAWSIPAIMASACGDQLGPRLAPAALGFITLFFGIGQAFGPIVAGRLIDATGSFAPAFITAAIAAWIGGVLSIITKHSHRVAG